MKSINLFLLLLLGFSGFSQPARLFVQNQIILQFEPSTTQWERYSIARELGQIIQDEDGDRSTIDDIVLVEVDIFPVRVGGFLYTDELDLVGTIHQNQARVDGSNLNYILQNQAPASLPQGSYPGAGNYSPMHPACENNYPGGALVGNDFSTYNGGTVRVAILDTGLDPYYRFINQYLTAAVDVLSDDGYLMGAITRQIPYNFANPAAEDHNGHGTAVTGSIAGLADRAFIPPSAL